MKKREAERVFVQNERESVIPSSALGNNVTLKRASLNSVEMEELVVVKCNLELLRSAGMRH